MKRIGLGVAAIVAAASVLSLVHAQAPNFPSTKNGEWAHYTADVKGWRYSPLDQITATNFNQLEVAWRFKTDNLGTRPEFKLEGTPLMVKGVVYATGGTRRSVVALDAKTGELIWVHAEKEGARAATALRPRALLLDGRQRRRSRDLRHDRLSPRRAQREDRRAGPRLRDQRRRRHEDGRRGGQGSADRSRNG